MGIAFENQTLPWNKLNLSLRTKSLVAFMKTLSDAK
jgi:hypothetical protein